MLHTHMRMTGSWHVYTAGEAWRRPEWQARVVLECGDRVAVCFNAPVVELVDARLEPLHPSLAGLGPDLLAEPLDVAAVRARARSRPPDAAVADVLLDQRVAAGIGNVYRSEVLFLRGIDPSTPVGALDDGALDTLVATAARLLRANANAGASRSTGVPGGGMWVYRRAGRPCRRCGTLVRTRRSGPDARSVYWCPRCQPPVTDGTGRGVGPGLPEGTAGP